MSVRTTKNDSFLIKSMDRQYCIECIDRLQSIDSPFTTELMVGKFSCKLVHLVNPFKSNQIIVKLIGLPVTFLYAADVVFYDTTPNKAMVLEKDEWTVTLDMKKQVCFSCVLNRQMSSLINRNKVQYHFPSHNLYLYRKPHTKKGQSTIVNHVASLLDNETSADIEFHVNGTKLVAHSLIVSAGSPVLAAMFQNDFQEKSKRIATINDTTVEVFQQFLRYLYTGDVLENKKDAIVPDLFALADKYGVDSLKDECAVYMAEQLSVENAVDTLIAAHLHSSTILYEETVSFISRNMLTVCSCADWLSFMKEYPELCFVVNKSIIEVNYTSVL